MPTHSPYGPAVFIERFGSSASVMKRITFAKQSDAYDEAWLQSLVMSHPTVLAADEIEPAFATLVPVCTELPTGSGFIDNLLVTPNGDLAIIECKLWRNPEARREVVAQIIQYAKDLARWSFEELEQAVSRAQRVAESNGSGKRRLYDFVSSQTSMDEVRFHDAVCRNLRRGRFLMLIIGDGIREGIEGMTEFLQQHAGLHFTLGVVELAVYELPGGGYVVQPRILTRTRNIDRGIVTIQDGFVTIGSPVTSASTVATSATRSSITKERFIEELEANCPGTSVPLNAFINKLEEYGITCEFGVDSMILRWHDDARSWNVGVIRSSGDIATDWMSGQVVARGLSEAGEKYLFRLEKLVPGAFIRKTPKRSGWYVKNLRIDDVLKDTNAQESWLRAIQEFQSAASVD